jgi:hypothetical protein
MAKAAEHLEGSMTVLKPRRGQAITIRLSDSVHESLRNLAIGSMRGEGANPDLLVMNSTDAAALDLSTSGTSTPYLFAVREPGGASPLFGLRVIERTSTAGNEPPYVLDSNMLGRLYLGTMRIDADPFTGFKKNLTTLRCEVKALFHVRNAKGARRIAAT